MTTIQKITIYGERCSGTNYLETLLARNFHDYKLTWEYGWKHFFGHQNLQNSDRIELDNPNCKICLNY